MVRRAISAPQIDTADLGPSGSDAFSQLKSKYGFASVHDWPAVADYKGPVFCGDDNDDDDNDDDTERFMMMNLLRIIGER